MNRVAQYEMGALLEMSGARPRGNRHDCPRCAGLRTVTHTAEAFFCHRCQWKGNAVTLAKELGVYERVTRAEYIRQRKARERAESEARNFLAACRMERLRACGELCDLGRLEIAAHEAGPDRPLTWNALEIIYRQRPSLTAEAVLLGEGAIAVRRRWLEADTEGRARIAEDVLLAGGLKDDAGKFLEVEYPEPPRPKSPLQVELERREAAEFSNVVLNSMEVSALREGRDAPLFSAPGDVRSGRAAPPMRLYIPAASPGEP